MATDELLLQHKFIIFCPDHYNPLGVVRSLGEMKIKPIVILVSKNPHMVPRSKYVGIIHRVPDIDAGLHILLEKYGHEKEKPFVYTCSDDIASLLDLNYNRLIDKFYFFHGKEQGIVTRYTDKRNILDLALDKGCKVLRYEEVEKGELPKGLRYPVITKAITPTLYNWKGDSFICKNEEELLEAYKSIRSERVLIQEYIHKKNEYCVDGFSYNHGENVEIPYYTNYLRFSDISYGAYMIVRPNVDKQVFEQIKRILKEVEFIGIFSVEFLIGENDELYFLEVNFRNSTWSYAYTYGGYNMPYLWAKATLEQSLDLSEIHPKEKFIAISEFEDYVLSVKSKQISIWKWLKAVLTADCHFIFNWKDQKPFWKAILSKFK